jgi:hypothetical protein
VGVDWFSPTLARVLRRAWLFADSTFGVYLPLSIDMINSKRVQERKLTKPGTIN